MKDVIEGNQLGLELPRLLVGEEQRIVSSSRGEENEYMFGTTRIALQSSHIASSMGIGIRFTIGKLQNSGAMWSRLKMNSESDAG